MKLKYLILIIIISVLFQSCRKLFNPRYYYNNGKSNNTLIEINNKKQIKLIFTSLELKNIDIQSAERNIVTGNTGHYGQLFNYALFGYDIKLDFYSSSNSIHFFKSLAFLNPKNISEALKVNVSDTENINIDVKEYLLGYDDKILILVNITKYDQIIGDLLEVHYPYVYCGNDKIKIELRHNSSDNTFELFLVTDGYRDRIISKTEFLSADADKEAEIFILIDGMDGENNENNCGEGPTGLNNTIELKIKFIFQNIV
ncbi:hypothetical protein [uncultured Brachyspira sp.]|uniref:hypothetical protein n=1 Tax=uncultured Brachyspira sp. TaxID=221953 RepID=UPI0025DFE623|nr:hypothetical protein [uncultured Brachyspira sp.]